MQYTTTELKWIENLIDKAIMEANESMERLADHPLRALAELNRDNMLSLLEKTHKDMAQLRKRIAR